MNFSELYSLQAVAKEWRENSGSDQQKTSGVVLIWANEVYGWKNELRDPNQERPGAYAVLPDGTVYKAIGGNDYDGAEHFMMVGGGA